MTISKKIKVVFLFLFASANILSAQIPGEQLFDNSYLHQINFEAENLEEILNWENGFYTGPVKLVIDNHVVDSVHLRRKGYTSNEFNETNPPFKIDVDEFIENREYDGIDKFNLHNHHLDTFYQRNALAYHLYRRAGAAAPRTAFAEVYINGKFIDIYTITEDVEKTFLKNNFASNKGSLYKGKEFPFNGVVIQEGTIDAHERFINQMNTGNFQEIISAHNFFRVIAVDLIIKDWDAYAFENHNYYLYQEPNSEKLHLITWDHNFAFPINDTMPNILFTERPPLAGLIAHPEIKTLYLLTFCKLMSYLIEDSFIEWLTRHNHTILTSNTNHVFIPDPAPIIEFMENQRLWFAEALRKEGYTNCGQLISPVGENDVVINEFVAKNNGGVIDPNNGTSDWIELYNTTNRDIVLNEDFYLSNSSQFLKKWHFQSDTTIPANGFLILWADRDVHQEGLHTNFKLNGDGGSLFFTHENTTPLQQVVYQKQTSNYGFSRYPNGFGEFRIQPHTFNSSNGPVVSNTEKKEGPQILIAPNPASDKLFIKNYQVFPNCAVQLINSMGITVLTAKAAPEINISGLTAGVYFVRITTYNDCITTTLIIQ